MIRNDWHLIMRVTVVISREFSGQKMAHLKLVVMPAELQTTDFHILKVTSKTRTMLLSIANVDGISEVLYS